MPSILLVVKHARQDEENARQMVRIAQETASSPMDDRPKGATAGGDERKLRGIPCIARGVGGAIPGTSPHQQR